MSQLSIVDNQGIVKKETDTKVRTPPHTCLPVWIDRFFEAVKEVNTAQITSDFIAGNVVASNNEGKVLKAIEFLGLVDENGNVTSRLRLLRAIGDEFTTNLASVVQQAYSDLLGTISIKSASYDRLINFLIQRYSFGQSQARAAARFFIHLASKARLPMSQELVDKHEIPPTPENGGKTPHAASSTKKTVAKRQKSESEIYATIESPFGSVQVTDLATLDLARNLLGILETKFKGQGKAAE